MGTSIFRFSLDIHQTQSQVSISASRYSTDRRLMVRLMERGIPYVIEDGCFAVFSAIKPDGKPLYNDCAIRNNTIIYDFTKQTTAALGIYPCQIHLYGADGRLLLSPRFQLIVHDAVYDEEAVESSGEYLALEGFLNHFFDSYDWRGEKIFIRYSANSDGADFTETWTEGQNYIGIARGLEAPEAAGAYEWAMWINGGGGNISDEQIASAVEAYLTENPIESPDAAESAAQAANSAESARQSMDEAETAATDAKQSAQNAESSADEASESATNAGQSATNAAESASQAASSAEAAESSASTAQTAKEAAESAQATAETAATNAENSATAAQTAQVAAETVKAEVEEKLANGDYTGEPGKSAYEIWLSQEGNEGKSEAEFLASLRSADALPYGGSKEWLEQNGDTAQLYRIGGYIWGYIESNGWTKSNTQFLVVSGEEEMTNEGGTAYLLRNGDTGTVYAYTEASGDADVPVYDSLPETANEGDIVAVGDRKYQASVSTVEVEHNAYDASTATFNQRLNSSGEAKDLGGALLLDYAEVSYDTGCILTIRGIEKLVTNYSTYFVVDYYDANKTRIGQVQGAYLRAATSSTNVAGSGFDGTLPLSCCLFLTPGGQIPDGIENTGYVRIKLGIAADGTSISAADVEGLVVNFSTMNTTETRITWTDIGAYIPPVEAGWSATDETYAVIDSLTDTANSGDSAVYSADGYLYTYIAGAAWAQTSKYDPPALELDKELSDSSTFAVQNRVVTSAILSEQAKTKQNTADIDDLKGQVAELAAGSGSVTPPENDDPDKDWKAAADECVATVKSLQVGKNCVTFPFFSDNHQRLGYAGRLIAYVMKECDIPYAFFGGDCITSGAPVTTAPDDVFRAEAANFDDLMAYIPEGRLCRVVGNHEHYLKYKTEEDGDTLTLTYTRDQVYDVFLRGDGLTQTKQYGEDGTYYYVDDLPSKVRFVVLNTNRKDMANAGTEVIDDTQLDWLQNTALSFGESGWGVVIFSHCPISNHFHANVSNNADVVAMLKDYTNGSDPNKAEIIGWFSGHIHRDRMYTHMAVNGGDGIPGEDGEELGFTQVTITSDNTSIAYKKDDGSVSDEYHAIDGSIYSHAIDFVTVNRASRTVNLTRLGIGEDRSFTY